MAPSYDRKQFESVNDREAYRTEEGIHSFQAPVVHGSNPSTTDHEAYRAEEGMASKFLGSDKKIFAGYGFGVSEVVGGREGGGEDAEGSDEGGGRWWWCRW